MLNDDEVRTIADIAIRSESTGCPQDTEWAIAGGKAYIVQTRPITTLKRAGEPTAEAHEFWCRGCPRCRAPPPAFDVKEGSTAERRGCWSPR